MGKDAAMLRPAGGHFLERCMLGLLLQSFFSDVVTSSLCAAFSNCSENEPLMPGPLSSPGLNYEEYYERRGQSKALDFCVKGFTSIRWSKRTEEGRYLPFSLGPGEALCRQNQTLSFRSLQPGAWFYNATASNGTHLLERIFILRVSSSASPSQRVVPYNKPPRRVEAYPGSNVSLTCSGHFGHGERYYRMLEWDFFNGNTRHNIDSDEPPFHIEEFKFSNTSLWGKRLDIMGVRQENLPLQLQCIMSTVVENNSFTFNVTVVLHETDLPTAIIVTVSVLLVLAIMVIAFILMYWRWKQCIDYHCALRCGRLKSRGNKFKFDIFLFTHEENMHFARGRLLQELDSHGFQVCEYQSEAPANRQEVEAQTKMLRQCACAVLVLSLADLDNYAADTLVSLATFQTRPLVVVYLDSPKDFQTRLDQLPPDQQQNLRRVREMFPCLTWPEKEDSRHVRNFWYRLRRHLPRPAPRDSSRPAPGDSSRPPSAQPLLSATSEESEESEEAGHPPTVIVRVDEEKEAEAGRATREVRVPGRRDDPTYNKQVSVDSGFAASPQSWSPDATQGPLARRQSGQPPFPAVAENGFFMEQ